MFEKEMSVRFILSFKRAATQEKKKIQLATRKRKLALSKFFMLIAFFILDMITGTNGMLIMNANIKKATVGIIIQCFAP